MIYSDLLSPVQLKKLLGGNAMSPFITVGSRTTCKKCGHNKFVRIEDDEDGINIPACAKCFGKPKLYRVGFRLPVVGGTGFRKFLKSRNELGEPLDKLTKAKNFLSYIENKIKKEGINFDPREIGSEKERASFLIKNVSYAYLKDLGMQVDSGKRSPSGYGKMEGEIRRQVVPLFGEYNVKDVSYKLFERIVRSNFVKDTKARELKTAMSAVLTFSARQGLINTPPSLPSYGTSRKKTIDDFYTGEERDLVISNIKNPKLKAGVMILRWCVGRKCEIRCLRWGDISFSGRGSITFSRHLSEGRAGKETREMPGLKSSPDKVLVYPFFPGGRELLASLVPSLDPNELVFRGRGKGGFLGKNAFYEAWMKSVNDLFDRGLLSKKVDLHRGTRSSTLSDLLERGHTFEDCGEAYGGDLRTMKDYYAKKKMQNVSHLWGID